MARDLRTQLWQSLCEIDGVDEGSSVFAEDDACALWVDATQVAHFVTADTLEVRLTKQLISADRASLKADPRVTLRKNASDWLEVKFSRADGGFTRRFNRKEEPLRASGPPEASP
jgi:hypothetical protein